LQPQYPNRDRSVSSSGVCGMSESSTPDDSVPAIFRLSSCAGISTIRRVAHPIAVPDPESFPPPPHLGLTPFPRSWALRFSFWTVEVLHAPHPMYTDLRNRSCNNSHISVFWRRISVQSIYIGNPAHQFALSTFVSGTRMLTHLQ
jgi:hypothetical protein